MAFVGSNNNLISGANDLVRAALGMFTMKDFLVSTLGTYSHLRSGTGNSGAFSVVPGTDLWINGTYIVGQGAWWNGLNASTGAEILLSIRNTASQEENWGLSWSRAAGFSGGAPDEVTLPTATDEVVVADRTLTHFTVPVVNYNMHLVGEAVVATPSFLMHIADAVNDLRGVYGMDWLTDARAGDTIPAVGWAYGAVAFTMDNLSNTQHPGGGYDVDDIAIRNRTGTNGFQLMGFRNDATSQDPFVSNFATADPRTGNVITLEVPVITSVGPNAHFKGVSSLFRRVPSSLNLYDTLDSLARVVLAGTTGRRYTVPNDGATTPSP